MQTITIRCSSCGASIKAKANKRLVNCTFCQSQLELKSAENSADKFAHKASALELKRDLQRLHGQLAYARDVYYYTDEDGKKYRPTKLNAMISCLVWLVIGLILWIDGADWKSYVILICIGAVAAFHMWDSLKRLRGLEKAESDCARRRSEIIQQLGEYKNARV